MLERLNRSLLQMLQVYVQKQHDWKCHLPLVLLAYRTTVHSSTGMTSLGLMFGRAFKTNSLQPETALEPESYQAHLKHKLEEIKDFVKLRSPFRQNARKRKIVHVNRIHREIQPQQADPCSTNGTSKQWCQTQIATLFSQKIHQTRVLLDILDGFDIHKIDCNIRLKDKPSIKGSSVIYCIVIDIYLYD